tara:strand:+ start:641 stop:985 length:345 start_codon:yes stop_codon:yes gene_type:complete
MDNLKDIEVKAIYRSLIRNDYPSKLRKSFVEKVMNKIKSSEENHYSHGNILLRYASVFVFAVLTLYVLNYQNNDIEYSKTNIEITSPKIENVVNQTDSCENNKDSHNKEEKACK